MTRGLLGQLERRLCALYDVTLPFAVSDALCDASTAEKLGGAAALERGEVLFVVEHDEGEPAVALYLEEPARSAQRESWLGDRASFRACSLVAEGVSHVAYLAFRAEHEQPVSELELELQAEVDKWALGLLLEPAELLRGRGVGLVALRDRSRRLRRRLFEEIDYLDAAGTERGDRYRAAVRGAARFVARAEERFVRRGAIDELQRELRLFYRLGAREKLERAR